MEKFKTFAARRKWKVSTFLCCFFKYWRTSQEVRIHFLTYIFTGLLKFDPLIYKYMQTLSVTTPQHHHCLGDSCLVCSGSSQLTWPICAPGLSQRRGFVLDGLVMMMMSHHVSVRPGCLPQSGNFWLDFTLRSWICKDLGKICIWIIRRTIGLNIHMTEAEEEEKESYSLIIIILQSLVHFKFQCIFLSSS